MRGRTNSLRAVRDGLLASFDGKADSRLLFRRLGISACDVTADDGVCQLDLLTDYDALERERKIQAAMLRVRSRYGANALFMGKNLLKGATSLERNRQIGGHRA